MDDGVSLRDHVEALIAAQEKLFNTRLEERDKALVATAELMEKRLESMNEFRETIKDQTSRHVTKDEHGRLITEVQALAVSAAEVRGKASQQSVIVAYIIAIIGIMVSLVGLFK